MPPQNQINTPASGNESKTKCSDPLTSPIIETILNGNQVLDNNIANKSNDNDNTAPQTMIKQEDMDFDQFLPYVKEFGLYQRILFFLMFPFICFVVWVYFTQIFLTTVPDHWCIVPELASLDVEARKALLRPKDEYGNPAKCKMYKINYTEYLFKQNPKVDESEEQQTCIHGWEYDYAAIPYTTVGMQFGWVCDWDSLNTWAQSIFFVGAFFGGIIFGWIADRYGRIPAMIGANLTGCVAGVMTAFAKSTWFFICCRFLMGMAYDNCVTIMYILVLEYVGPKWRSLVGNMSLAVGFTFASTTLPWIAYYLRDWQVTSLVTSVPLCLVVFAPLVIPESARWLVSQGRIDEAIHILKKFERVNGTKVPQHVYQQFKETCHRVTAQEETNKRYSVIDLLKTPRLRKITLLLAIIWMIVALVFDGHVRNLDNLGLNLFITFTVASSVEFPADTFLYFTLDKFGRRWLESTSLILSGIFSLWACCTSNPIYVSILAVIGRFWINISYTTGLQYVAELLPTVVRGQGSALIHMMGYLASIASPFVARLDKISVIPPFLVLGILGVIGGLLAFCLPETLNKDLPETMQDGENFGKDQKLWDCPCLSMEYEEKEPPTIIRNRSRSSSMQPYLRGEILRSSMIGRSRVKSIPTSTSNERNIV